MNTLYSVTAAARMLHLNPARLQRWLNFGYFKPEHTAFLGYTEARLFTEEEIEHLKAVVELIDSGMPVQKAFSLMAFREPDEDGSA